MAEILGQLLAITHKTKIVGGATFIPGSPNKAPVLLVIIRHQDGEGLSPGNHSGFSLSRLVGMVTVKVEPVPGVLCAVIVPPWCSAIRRQIARPMPVPSNSLRPCNRWNIAKMRSAYFCSKP